VTALRESCERSETSETSDPARDGGLDVCIGLGISDPTRDEGRDDVAPFTRPLVERAAPVGISLGLNKSALDRLDVDKIPDTSESALLPPVPF